MQFDVVLYTDESRAYAIHNIREAFKALTNIGVNLTNPQRIGDTDIKRVVVSKTQGKIFHSDKV